MRTHTLLTYLASQRVRMAALGLWVLTIAPVGAQTTGLPGVQIDTPLMTFFTGMRRAVKVTVSEVGPRGVLSTVRIVYRDPLDRIIARAEGTLSRTRPVSFELPLEMADPRVQVRATVVIFGVAGRQTKPIAVVEEVDTDSLAIEQRISCAPPANREGPVTPYCPEVVVTQITVG